MQKVTPSKVRRAYRRAVAVSMDRGWSTDDAFNAQRAFHVKASAYQRRTGIELRDNLDLITG